VLNRGGGSTNPRDGLVAGVFHGAVGRLHGRYDTCPGVDQPDAHLGGVAGDGNQVTLDGERPNTGQDVAAGRRPVDSACFRVDLGEKVVDVDVVIVGWTDDRYLARGGCVAAEAVDLAGCTAHESRQHLVERVGVGGEIVAQQVHTLGRSAAKLHGRQ
jgi:hypothetical protein